MRHLLLFLFASIASFAFSQNASLMLPIGHTDAVNTVVYSPNGKWILSGGEDGNVKVWESGTGRELQSTPMKGGVKQVLFNANNELAYATDGLEVFILHVKTGQPAIPLAGHQGFINHLALNTQGTLLATACQDKKLRIYDAHSGILIRTMENHLDAVRYAEFNQAGTLLLSAGWDYTALLTEVKTGKIIRSFNGHEGNLNTAHFSPDEKWIITASWDKSARIFETASGKLVHQFTDHRKSLVDAQFTKDMSHVITASKDHSVKVYVNHSWTERYEILHSSPVTSMGISGDSHYLMSSDQSGIVHIYDIIRGSILHRIEAHVQAVNQIALSPTLKTFIIASSDNSLLEYSYPEGVLLSTLKGETEKVDDFVYSPDGKWMAAIHQDSIVRIVEVTSGSMLGYSVPGGKLYSIRFNAEGTMLALGGESGTIFLIRPQTGKIIRSFTASHGVIRCIRWGTEDRNVFVSGDESVIRSYLVSDGSLMQEFAGHSGPVLDIALSRDGNWLISGGFDSSVGVYALPTATLKFQVGGLGAKVNQVGIHPDNQSFFAVAGSKIYSYEIVTAAQKNVFTKHNWFIHDAGLSPDGDFLVSVGADNQIVVNEWNTGKVVYSLSGNQAPVYSLSFHPKGNLFAVAGGDQLVRVFELSSGKETRSFRGHFAPLRKVSFSPDGNYLISIGRGHQTVIWDYPNNRQLYSRMQLNDHDWLLYDADFRYDGSEGARNRLFLSCGTEAINLNQIKEALYVPGLAALQYTGQKIDFPTLASLDLCGGLPVIQPGDKKTNGLDYEIVPGKHEVKQVEVYVNHRLSHVIPKDSLAFINGKWQLHLEDTLVSPLYASGQKNEVEIVPVASSGDKTLKARGIIELIDKTDGPSASPVNLYAIMIGVNEYQDPDMRLDYPVKDARAVGEVIK
ncbi:MAG: WD40 repeat domain-containing protein, partial [Bacteroidota bacterium]|nr:WD40 repeat domain-containing protein [Bacteroidota bacterium]MDX5430655.1 WD40 repeat domain-containing protein [Bacteroidota bacterium]MDX5469405.1 WD40 repeat domain-containing protein [Bacteroidota bacterium]